MSAMASQITGVPMVCSSVSSADQKKHQSSASLAFVGGIRRWPVNYPHKRPVTRIMFPFDDAIMAYDSLIRRPIYASLGLGEPRFPNTNGDLLRRVLHGVIIDVVWFSVKNRILYYPLYLNRSDDRNVLLKFVGFSNKTCVITHKIRDI